MQEVPQALGLSAGEAQDISSATPSDCSHPAPAVGGWNLLLAWAQRRDVTWGFSYNVLTTFGKPPSGPGKLVLPTSQTWGCECCRR